MTREGQSDEEYVTREELVAMLGDMGEEIAAGLEAMHSANSGFPSELTKITDFAGVQISPASPQGRPESGPRP